MSTVAYYVLRTTPTHRVEFEVLREVTQRGYPALLPFERVYEKRPGKARPIERKYALFPCYVFVGLADPARDFERLRTDIPEIKGIVSRSRDAWSPLALPPHDVAFLTGIVRQSMGATETDIHKALKPGKAVEVNVGGAVQQTRIDEVTKRGVKVRLEMFGAMHVVEVPFGQVRAA